MESERIERQANKLVRLALISERKRSPLKREDIIKYTQACPKNFTVIYDLAQQKLLSVFGMNLVELTVKDNPRGASKSGSSKKDSSQSAKAKGSRTYILQNKLSIETKGQNTPKFNSLNESKFLAVTMTILSLLFVNNHVLSHASILNYFQKFNISDFKEKKNLIQMMLKQGYLIRFPSDQNGTSRTGRSSQRLQAGNEAEEFANLNYNYQWGPRAKAEITIEGLLFFMQEVFGDQAPFNLSAQLNRFETELAQDV